MSAVTTIVCVLALATLASADRLERIVGGQSGSPGQFPFTVAIRNEHNQHICAGVIITGRLILTAAHCIPGDALNPTNLFVYVGVHTLQDGIRHRLRRTVRHPNYNPQFALNDISVLITDTNIRMSNLVRRAQLPGVDVPDNVPVTAFVSGLGLTRVRYGISNHFLLNYSHKKAICFNLL